MQVSYAIPSPCVQVCLFFSHLTDASVDPLLRQPVVMETVGVILDGVQEVIITSTGDVADGAEHLLGKGVDFINKIVLLYARKNYFFQYGMSFMHEHVKCLMPNSSSQKKYTPVRQSCRGVLVQKPLVVAILPIF